MSDISVLVRYRILAAVHMYDLRHGGKKRDWAIIKDLAEVIIRQILITIRKLNCKVYMYACR